MAQPRDREGDAVVVVGMLDERVTVEIDEGAPVQAHAQLRQRQRIERRLQVAGTIERRESRQVVVDAPAVVGVVDGQLGDAAKVREISRDARIVGGQRRDQIGERERDLAGKEFVRAIEDGRPVDSHGPPFLHQLLHQPLELRLDPPFHDFIERRRGSLAGFCDGSERKGNADQQQAQGHRFRTTRKPARRSTARSRAPASSSPRCRPPEC